MILSEASDEQRDKERDKYIRAYGLTNYHMSQRREDEAAQLVADNFVPGTLLDVGCGRGEFIGAINKRGWRARGMDPVPLLSNELVVEGYGHSIPYEDNSFDYCTSFDVLEHLLRDDDVRMLREMKRVARIGVCVSANNKPVQKQSKPGKIDELHINRRTYEEWDGILFDLFGRESVTTYRQKYSPMWVCKC